MIRAEPERSIFDSGSICNVLIKIIADCDINVGSKLKIQFPNSWSTAQKQNTTIWSLLNITAEKLFPGSSVLPAAKGSA